MKLLVCGSRSYDDFRLMDKNLRNIVMGRKDVRSPEDLTIIEGEAIGADFLGRVWAKYYGFKLDPYKAEWKKYGYKAGHLRNEQMLVEGKPDMVVAFWDGKSTGTGHMIDISRKAGLEVRVISFEN